LLFFIGLNEAVLSKMRVTSKRFYHLYVPVTVHREQSVKKEYQQDATI